MRSNYIHQLQDQVKTLESEKEIIQSGLDELMRYMQSSKFHCGDELDGYVNISDVVSRLVEIKMATH